MTLTIPDLLGPLLTAAQMQALSGAYADYDRRFAEGSDGLAARGALDWYYDGPLVHYAAAARIRSSDPARALLYEQRGDALALTYRATMDRSDTLPQMMVVFKVHPAGLAIHYERTKDPLTLQTIADLTNAMWTGWGRKSVFHRGIDLSIDWEPRYIGRILETFLIAHLLGIPSPGYTIIEGTWMDGPPAWGEAVQQIVAYAAKCQNVDGAWRSSAYGGEQCAYNAGILLNILLDVDRLVGGPLSLRPMIHKAVEFLRTQWTPTGFQYASGAFDMGGGNTGGTDPAKDLTGLLVTPVAWSATHGGRVTTAWAEEVFAQMVASADITGGKQLNEYAENSYKAAALLHPAPALSPGQRLGGIAAIDHVRRSTGRESKATKAALLPIADFLRAGS